MLNLRVGKVEVRESDIKNIGDWEYTSRCFVIGHEFGVIGVVFADCEADALDILADNGDLDSDLVPVDEVQKREAEGEEFLYLGNASEPFDMPYLWMEEIHVPTRETVLKSALADWLNRKEE